MLGLAAEMARSQLELESRPGMALREAAGSFLVSFFVVCFDALSRRAEDVILHQARLRACLRTSSSPRLKDKLALDRMTVRQKVVGHSHIAQLDCRICLMKLLPLGSRRCGT